MKERDRNLRRSDATDDDYMKAAELEGVFAEYGGYDAGPGGQHPHRRRHSRIAAQRADARGAPGLKLRVLLAQALFSRPDVLLWTSRPTISTSFDPLARKRPQQL